MTASASSQSRSLTARRSISRCRRAAWDWDIGCGSGALTIACAKRNPQGKMIGIDRWGKEYASFTLPLCEKNAAAEGVKNALFRRGNAVKLDFPDESFDAVTSNYVYHNITGKDKQQLLLETLRVLKKGGTFAIHDLMSPGRYGDMQAFVQKLRDMGYERVELLDTTDGSFMTPKEAKRLMLRCSTLLVGRSDDTETLTLHKTEINGEARIGQ